MLAGSLAGLLASWLALSLAAAAQRDTDSSRGANATLIDWLPNGLATAKGRSASDGAAAALGRLPGAEQNKHRRVAAAG